MKLRTARYGWAVAMSHIQTSNKNTGAQARARLRPQRSDAERSVAATLTPVELGH
jgi:hypothetical protein